MRLNFNILDFKLRRRKRIIMLLSDFIIIVRASFVKKNVQLKNIATASSDFKKRFMIITLRVKVTFKELKQELQSKKRQQNQQK